MIRYGGGPSDWIAAGGAPARCLGDPRGGGGLPSFEHVDGDLVVYDLLLALFQGEQVRLFSPWYGTACLLAPDETVPLHHGEGALWDWRPQLYRLGLLGDWQGLGSQQELGWRAGLTWAITWRAGGGDLETAHEHYTMAQADERAEVLLRENLTPFQLVELAATGCFRVRGAATRNLYLVEPGNGFAIVCPVTGEKLVDYCLHPEAWMPSADVALATKFALEDEEMEVETLEEARMTAYRASEPKTPALRAAAEMERELIV